jgi:serine/threonine-protein kinase
VIGQLLDHFRVVARIGAGGMGVVYRAHDERLDRDLALKVLPPDALADPEARRRFQSEALALSRLNHPNICTIHQVGEVDGQTYIAMEYVEGQPLSELLGHMRVPVDAIVRYGIQIAAGLAHAHDRGLVHRDLKSANIVITPDGRVKILDFGLAVMAAHPDDDATRTATATGTVVGTLAYMAPEVLRGEHADARSDVWALGVVLHEALAGERPFQGATAYELTASVLERSPAPMPDAVPPALAAIVMRCLAKQPGERYQRASEVGAALETVQTQSQTARHALPPPVPTASPRTRQWRPALAVAGALVAVLALAVLLDAFGMRGWFGLGGEPPPIRSLAVLPFDNISGDADQEYFADGMTDALIAELAQQLDIRVISRASTVRYKGSQQSIQDIAAELNVDAVVAGGAMIVDGRVRITPQLVRATSDESLWTEAYQRDLRDVLTLQSEMAQTIGRQIRAALTPVAQAAGRRAAVNPDAYQLTLQGQFFARQLSQNALERGIRFFEEALDTDPSYAPAYAGLAFAYVNLSSVYLPPRDMMPRVKAAATRAIELDPTLPDPHIWLSFAHLFFDWDWDAAERELGIALRLNPDSAEARVMYSNYLLTTGRTQDAVDEAVRAKDIAPLALLVYAGPMGSQWTAYQARDYERSIAEGHEALAIDADYSWTHAYLGMAMTQLGRLDEAVAQVREANRLEDAPMLKAFLAHTYAIAGRTAEAEALLAELEAFSARNYMCAYEIAVTHAALNQTDAAFRWLDKALEDRADCIPYLIVDPRLDGLRDDPRFQALLDQVDFPTRRRDN